MNDAQSDPPKWVHCHQVGRALCTNGTYTVSHVTFKTMKKTVTTMDPSGSWTMTEEISTTESSTTELVITSTDKPSATYAAISELVSKDTPGGADHAACSSWWSFDSLWVKINFQTCCDWDSYYIRSWQCWTRCLLHSVCVQHMFAIACTGRHCLPSVWRNQKLQTLSDNNEISTTWTWALYIQ